MKTNIGTLDKTIRIIVGLAIIAAGVFFKSWWGVIGLLPLLTGISGFCALYTLLGVNTCSRQNKVEG